MPPFQFRKYHPVFVVNEFFILNLLGLRKVKIIYQLTKF